MSVASRNPFALLGGDEDAPAVSAAAPAAKTEQAAPKRNIPGSGVNSSARGGAAPAARGARGGARGGRAAADGGANDEEAPQKETRGAARGAARGRGEGRGRGVRGTGRGRGRVFDRHSQTGKEDSAKNIHQGWGGDDPKRELDVDENARADAAEEGANPAGETPTAVNGSATPAEGEVAGAKAEVVEEEKDNTKTLDEYLAEQAEKRAQIGAKKEARAADAADPDALGKRLEKQDAEDYYKIQKEQQVRQRAKKEKQLLEIEQSFNAPPAAARGGAGGRGRGGDRGRGGRGRGGDRGRGAPRGARGRGGASSGGASLNLSDNSAFPTLG